MSIQFQGHPANRAVTFQTFMFVFINNILVHYKKKQKQKQNKKKTFSRQSVIKVPNQYRTHMTFSYKIQAKTYTWPDMSFYAR